MRRNTTTRAFTLIEMVVVMGIAAALVAMTVPVARNLSNSNKGLRCASQLQRVSQALRMYVLDEGAVPPYYPVDPSVAVNPADPLDADRMAGQGLWVLFVYGYLGGESALHCPADHQHGRDNRLYAYSYMTRDETAAIDGVTAYGAYNYHKYLSSRGVRSDSLADADVRRQLCALPASPSTSTVPEFTREWHPDDSAVVTWCDHHAVSLKKGGDRVYQVLFWDGSVRRMRASLLRDGDPIAAAWRVAPGDDDTP